MLGKVNRRRHLSLVGDDDANARDKRAFAKYYHESYKRVYAYVYTLTMSHDETEDVVSEAFLKAAKAFDRFDDSKASFSTWVCTIARNVAYSRMRTRKRRDVWTESELDTDLSTIAAPEEEPGYEEDASQVAEKLLALLNDEERELVYLKFYQELSNKEIAVQLGMNASTVGTKLSRAVAKMRKAS
ncbi:MAG: RNA polymerase sigma factor [Atopobiaceae bacterium]|nr:RNA polymerase sigma factor [Atopobiaceae bacterium]